MAIISHEEAERYASGSTSEWFQLKNDGDVARVQFMYDKYDEIQTVTAHRVKVDDRERYVDCLRPFYDSPIEECPFCAEGIPSKPVRFIFMYDHDDGKVKIWERGKQFLTKLQGLFNRYVPLSEYVFEIERHGKAGDKKTTYDVYPLDRVDPVDLSDIEPQDIVGSIVLDKTAEEMEIYLDTGNFPEEEEQPTVVEEYRGRGRRGGVRRTQVAQQEEPRSRASRAQTTQTSRTSRRSTRQATDEDIEVF